MEQLDPYDGLPVWDFTEYSELLPETSPSSAWGCAARTWLVWNPGAGLTATTNRTVLVVTYERDLAAIADRVVTLANPGSRDWPGVQTEAQNSN